MTQKTSLTLKAIVDDNQKRLDIFLSEHLSISRSQAQKFIEQNQILVNDKLPKKAGDRLKKGDVVKLKKELKTNKKKSSKINPVVSEDFHLLHQTRFQNKAVKIITENSYYLIVDKPTGLLTHPTMAKEKNTLSSFLLRKYPEIEKVGENSLRPGIVHRLDKEASGLLVVARTQKMFKHLKKQFKARTVEKEYSVLVHGRVAKDEGEISFPIARSETHERMAARPLIKDVGAKSLSSLLPGEKEARTEFLVEKRFVNFTLLRVKIHTGRMHQIRVHFLAYNHPVVGDPLYIQKKRKKAWDEKLGRLFLHCTKLVFTDLENKQCVFNSPLPPELVNFLKLLK